jgi:aerobic carbon-monoxide dehydrogenase medium subunit
VIPAEFDYAAPTTLEEAVRTLASAPGAKLLAGGMSLIPAMKHRLAQPPLVVDIGRVPGLDAIAEEGQRLRIGARATHAAIAAHPAARALPILADAAAVIGDVQVRCRGTFGGSLVHADPAGDWPAVFLALGGEATLVGSGGERRVAAEDFFVSMLTSAVREDEVLTAVSLPAGSGAHGSAYRKLRQLASGFALVGVAAVVDLGRKGRIERAALAVTGVNAVPFRARGVEARLVGAAAEAPALRAACAAIEEADPMEDLHASAAYRRQVLSVLAARALLAACERAAA